MRARPYLIALALSASSAAAYDPIVIERGWYRVASDGASDGAHGCRGEVRTNGQFYVLAATGLVTGEPGRLQIFNGDMPPIDRAVRANDSGAWQQYYIPFRPNRGEAGRVFARLSAPGCMLTFEVPWQRRKGWDERSPLDNPYPR